MIQETLVKFILASRSPGGFSLSGVVCHTTSNSDQSKNL